MQFATITEIDGSRIEESGYTSGSKRCDAQRLKDVYHRVCAHATYVCHAESGNGHLSVEGLVPRDLIRVVDSSVCVIRVQYLEARFLHAINDYFRGH